MKKLILLFAITVIFTSSSFCQANNDYKQTLKKMFEVAGTEDTYKAAIKQMISIFKQRNSDVSNDIWNDLENEFLKTSIDTLVDMLVPVYNKYMTQSDLEEIIKFYETPIGQKFAKNTPLIMQDAIQIGQKWGLKIGQDIDRKIKEKKESKPKENS